MICPGCRHENRSGAKFCEECATPLPMSCPSCGTEPRATARFCDECGTRLPLHRGPQTEPDRTSAPPPLPTSLDAPRRSARKIVTIVFADLVGSTALHERLDAESVRRFMEGYYDAMRGAVAAHGGQVTQLLGDGVKAVFGAPRVAEDDALRAVRAGVAMQEAFHELAERYSDLVGETGLRVAVNTGEVVVDDEHEIIGDPVNVAARLQEQGRPGDVVIGGSTRRIVGQQVTLEQLGTFALKGRSAAVDAYRVVSLEGEPGAHATLFVGRDEELARLKAVFDSAVADGSARLATVLGSPGLGKSRLLGELVDRVGGSATVIAAHCEASGSASFEPIAAALRRALHLDAAADEHALRAAVAAVSPSDVAEGSRVVDGITDLLMASPASPEETFFVVRRFLAALARERAVVLVIDDLQWAEPLLLDLVEHLVQWATAVPLLVLVGARPELREARSSLAQPGALASEVLTLTGLDARAATRLAAGVIGASDLPAAVAGKLLAASEGNPLFVGELMRMMVDEGALRLAGDRWVATELDALEMPPSIQALLAARIERLAPEERRVLERAAVVGRRFSRDAVAALYGSAGAALEGGELDASLEALRRAELIERDSGWFLGQPALRFHHALIRDAAYRRLLKNTRVELHTRLADWIEAGGTPDPALHETIGWHLEQAHLHLRELGPLDEGGRRLGERAAARLAAAGRRSLSRDDTLLAASLLERSLGVLPEDAKLRPELNLDLCEALLSAGEVARAAGPITELDRLAQGSERLRAWHTCFLSQLRALTEPQSLQLAADEVAAAAERMAALEDVAGAAKAHFVHAVTLARLGRVGECEAALDRALASARKAGDRRRANAVLAGAPLAALWGPSPVARASGRCLDVVRVLRITQGAPAVEAVALCCQGVLEALRGRIDAARRMVATARDLVEELGIAHRLHEADVFAARIELLEGDAPTAERLLRSAYSGLHELGLDSDAAQAASLLATALLVQERVDEAEEFAERSECLSGDDLQASISWRNVRARTLAARGETAEALEIARESVGIAERTDVVIDHALARRALAEVLRADGRETEAAAEERRQAELWEAKGATLMVELARGAQGSATVGETASRHPEATEDRLADHRSGASQVVGTDRDTSETRPLDELFGNAASRLIQQWQKAFNAHDWEAVASYASPELVFRDLRRLVGVEGEAGMLDASARERAEMGATIDCPILGALGDRIVVTLGQYSGGPEDGQFEISIVSVGEIDETGRLIAVTNFDDDDLRSAQREAWGRWAGHQPEVTPLTEALDIFMAGARSRDLSRCRSVLAPDFVLEDHRRTGMGRLEGADVYLESIDAMLRLVAGTPIIEIGWYWPAIATDIGLTVSRVEGTTVQGGHFESEYYFLFILDGGPNGKKRISRFEFFELEHIELALARFQELRGNGQGVEGEVDEALLHPLANEATVAFTRVRNIWSAGDWDQWPNLLSPTFRHFDQRRLVQLELDRDQTVTFFRQTSDLARTGSSGEIVATRGERLVLVRNRIEMEGDAVGPSTIESLALFETDEHGLLQTLVRFDSDDLDAAYGDLEQRFLAGEGAGSPPAAIHSAVGEGLRPP